MKNEITTIEFHGAHLLAARGHTPAETMIVMKPVVEGMGLDWSGQRAKLLAHPILSKGMGEISIPSAGGIQSMTALPLSRLNFWLATIQSNKIPNPETRARVMSYQTECADVLFDHFFGKAVETVSHTELDAKAVGGIVKAVLAKQVPTLIEQVAQHIINEQLPAIVGAAIAADPRRAAIPNMTALEIAQNEGVPPRKRRGLVNSISARLRRYSQSLGIWPIPDARGVWTFPRSIVGPWLEREGRALISSHMARVNGQGVLPFPGKRKDH